MKLIYCIHSIYNPGGMERVTLNKLTWFAQHTDWNLMIVTTDQKGRPPFYTVPEKVRMEDMNVNYSDDNGKNPIIKTLGYLRRRQKHKKALTEILMRERPDIVVSLLPCESSFIPHIKDGSKKILELHQGKWFRVQYARRGLLGLSDKLRARTDERMVRKFDRFVILTTEDKLDWGGAIKNIVVIPNAAKTPQCYADSSQHRIIAIGRYDYQKGHDLLLKAWAIVCQEKDLDDWHLDIFGQGEWQEMLENMIKVYNISERVTLNPPTNNVWEEYSKSSVIALTSHYEGFPMVLAEAMSCGVVPVSFDCKCGPKDLIDNGFNGLLVKTGDVNAFAESLKSVMRNEEFRTSASSECRQVIDRYSEDRIMAMWCDLFNELVK